MTHYIPVLLLSHLFPASDVEAAAALLKRFVGLDELQQRRHREEEALYGEEEDDEDSLDNSSHSGDEADTLSSDLPVTKSLTVT